MGRPRTGYVTPHGDHFDARITLPGGKRSAPIHLDAGLTREQAEAIARQLSADAETAVGVVPREKGSTAGPGETFAEWAERWCKAREDRGLTSVDDDRGRLRKWINPKIGDKPIAGAKRVGRDDLEGLVEHLDEQVRAGALSWKTAANAWGLVTIAFADACRSKVRALRVRDDNPATDVRGPDRGASKVKVFLYPSEMERLLAAEAVPLRWRRLFAVTAYLYLRAAEIRGLEWPDVDLDHLAAHIHRTVDDEGNVDTTKGEAARRVPIEPAIVPLLQVMRAEAGGRGRVIERMPPEEDLAEKLRHWLGRAGVERADLFIKDATRKWMTFHDLRATGITWRAVRGDEPLRIMQCAGHKDFATTLKYIRTAEAVSAGFGDVFPPLPASLLGATSPTAPEGDGGGVLPEVSPDAAGSAVDVVGMIGETWRSQRELNPRSAHASPEVRRGIARVKPEAPPANPDRNPGDSSSAGGTVAKPSPREAAIAGLFAQAAAAVEAGDLEGARQLQQAAAGLLGGAAPVPAEGGRVVRLDARRGRR